MKNILIIGENKGCNRCMPVINELYSWAEKKNIKVYSPIKEMNSFTTWFKKTIRLT